MKEKLSARRIILMLTGILFIGICVAGFRLSSFGTDAFTCMNLGISGLIGMSFGTWQLLVNIGILVWVFFTVRKNIGIGTLVNMVCVGYIADFLCYLVRDVMGVTPEIGMRIVFLLIGMFCASFGCAMYMVADLGIAPYDSVAFIIQELSHGKISFRAGRVISDVTCVAIGVLFCIAAHNNLLEIVGIGTIFNAFCNGPFIQFYREHIIEPLWGRY